MLVDPQRAADTAHRAEPLAGSLPAGQARDRAIATALWLQAEALYRLEKLAHAKALIQRAAALAEVSARGTTLQADVLLTRGSIDGKLLRVVEALQDFQTAHRLFRASGDARHEAISLVCIAGLYFDAKDYGSALHYLDEALDSHHPDPGIAQSVLNTRGDILQAQGRLTEADSAFRRALGYARLLKSPALEATILRNLARNHLLAGQVASAEATIATVRRLPADDRDHIEDLALAAQAALQQHRQSEAARLIDQAFAGVDVEQTDARYRNAHLTAVAAYRALHRDSLALAHLAALKRLDDEATKLATQTSTALMAAQFNRANQDIKIAQLRDAERLRVARDALQRAQTERTLFLIGAGAAMTVMALLLVALVLIRRSRDKVRAANTDLAVTNSALGKALAAKTEFLATTSHEIRTPLNGILGMTQVMLADVTLTGPTRDRLTVVHGAGLTMRSLVDDILDVAKMETGNLGLDVAPFDPAAVVREASAIWAEQARAKGLTFTTDLSRCPPRVDGDAARVRQIVFNLLSNALKFTATGSVVVTAETNPDGALVVTVRDTGIGIAPDKHHEVFESFRQADTTTTRRFGGTGLGLAICRNLTEAMGGTIALASAVGQGSTFTVTLPLPIVATQPVVAVVTTGPQVLVIERNPIARAMLRTLLAPHAAAVWFAATVGEAVAAGDATHLLIDGATAQADGDARAFVYAVLAAKPDAAATLLWPAGDEAGRAAFADAGLAHLLTKPITGVALVATMFSPVFEETSGSRLVSQAA